MSKELILKHTGLTEEQFYKKYKDSDAFFKSASGKSFKAKYGSTLKKAQNGDSNNNGIPDILEKVQQGNNNQYTGTGNVLQTFGSGQPDPNYGPQNSTQPYVNNGVPAILQGNQVFGPQNKLPQPVLPVEDTFDPSSVIQYKQPSINDTIAKDQEITDAANNAMKKASDPGKKFESGIQVVDGIVNGFKALKAEKKALKSAKTWEKVSGLSRQAASSEDVNTKQTIADTANRTRKALMPTIQGEELFPVYGVGTNVLAQDGITMEERPGGMMGREARIPEVDAKPIPQKETKKTIDTNSARDIWVQKTGLPWSDAKRLGYTDGTAKDNIKLLSELNDFRFRKENLRKEAIKQSIPVKAPGQQPAKGTTPTKGKAAPASKSISYQEYYKGKPKAKLSQADIKASEDSYMINRIGERLANPIQTLGHYSKYGELPAEGFSKHDKNAYDQAIGLVNPFYWSNAAGNAMDYTGEEEYEKASWEALDALPVLGKLKHTKYIKYAKGLPPASVRRAGYLEQGAKQLGTGPAKQVAGKSAKQLGQGYIPNFTMHQHGGEIQNTYAPGDLYQDLAYEPLGESEPGYQPLSDDEIIKSYRSGGLIHAQGGWSFGNAWTGAGGSGGGGIMGMLGMGGGGSGGGGMMSGASGGGTPYAMIGEKASGVAGSIMDNNAGTQIGGNIGKAAGSAFGPVGQMIGQVAGTVIGGIADKNPKKIKQAQNNMMRNTNAIAGERGIKGFQSGYSGSFEDGGNLTNPIVITNFGGHSMNELLAKDPYMDTLRSGGNIRSNQVGDIEIDGDTGNLRPISYNPYTAGTGITSMIEGPSHDNGGTDVYYNGNKVNAEGGEPISERQDGGSVGNTSAVITGNQTFNKMGAHLIPELASYEGKKVKHIQKDLAEKDAKLNKLQVKNTKALNDFIPKNQIDKLTFNSLAMNEKGVNEQYKRNALKTESLIAYQDAINQEAESRGLDAGELSRGKFTKLPEKGYSKNGKKLYAEYGDTFYDTTTDDTTKIPEDQVTVTRALPEVPKGQHAKGKIYGNITEEQINELQDANPWYDWDTFDYNREGDVRHFQTSFNKLAQKVGAKERLNVDDKLGQQTASARVDLSGLNKGTPAPVTPTPATPAVTPVDNIYDVAPEKRHWWESYANQLMPWLRKTPGEELQGDQLAGEMYAMSHNDVEPVQARFYHPQLDVPYDISFQDRLNENQSTFNSMQRQAGSNPEALSILAGQKYGADSNVLAEQFRANQAKKDQVYSSNRATLNDAQLKNLSIADQQYERQAQAKSNTKAAMQEALNSVASKIGQNRLENRTLQTYANMFPDFSYDKNYSIRKTGAPTEFNMPVVYNEKGEATHKKIFDEEGKVIDFKPLTDEEKEQIKVNKIFNYTPPIVPKDSHTSPTKDTEGELDNLIRKTKERNGGLVKAFKNF